MSVRCETALLHMMPRHVVNDAVRDAIARNEQRRPIAFPYIADSIEYAVLFDGNWTHIFVVSMETLVAMGWERRPDSETECYLATGHHYPVEEPDENCTCVVDIDCCKVHREHDDDNIGEDLDDDDFGDDMVDWDWDE